MGLVWLQIFLRRDTTEILRRVSSDYLKLAKFANRGVNPSEKTMYVIYGEEQMFAAVILLVVLAILIFAFVGLSEAHAGVTRLTEEMDQRASAKDDHGFRSAA